MTWLWSCMLLFLAAAGMVVATESKEYRAFYRYFDREASPSLLRRRFRQLALEFHPDHQKAGVDKAAAQRKYLLLTTAYEKLLARSREADPGEEARSRRERAAAMARLKDEAQRKAGDEERLTKAANAERERQHRAAEAERERRLWREREERETRELEQAMLRMEEDRMRVSKLLEVLFVMLLSAVTVLGIVVSYYCFALRPDVLEIDRQRAELAATEYNSTSAPVPDFATPMEKTLPPLFFPGNAADAPLVCRQLPEWSPGPSLDKIPTETDLDMCESAQTVDSSMAAAPPPRQARPAESTAALGFATAVQASGIVRKRVVSRRKSKKPQRKRERENGTMAPPPLEEEKVAEGTKKTRTRQ